MNDVKKKANVLAKCFAAFSKTDNYEFIENKINFERYGNEILENVNPEKLGILKVKMTILHCIILKINWTLHMGEMDVQEHYTKIKRNQTHADK